jgi:hypothetical protein
MARQGLSFEQAPPLSVPLRFFLTAPLFLMMAGLLLAFSSGAAHANRWSPHVLALTHLVTLGCLAMVMTGALMQMLPVVAGSPVNRPLAVAGWAHGLLTVGTLLLATGFLIPGGPWLQWSWPTLALAFAIFLPAAGLSLARAVRNATTLGMKFALFSLAVAVALGLTLAGMRAGFWGLQSPTGWTDLHAVWGLTGWIGLLVIGVAYQVVPMFQLTPPYPSGLSRWLAPMIFAGIVLSTTVGGFGDFRLVGMLGQLVAAGGLLTFAAVTLRLQTRRRRRLPDVLLGYWRVAMVSLILVALLWLAGVVHPALRRLTWLPLLAGILFLGGFALSVVGGMLHKIVSFLCWFHLQGQLHAPAGTIPNMKEFVSEQRARMHFRLHLASVALLLAYPLWPDVAPAAGLALAVSAAMLEVNLWRAWRLFRAYGGKSG